MKSGLLLLNKPAGVRSAVCVAIAKRRLNGGLKVGHGGTLDSTAEGLLVLLAGGATRTSDMVMSLPKVYETTMLLGEERSTDDSSGEVLFSGHVPVNSRERIEEILPSFYGVRLQIPPGISAVRIAGKRAHSVVRSGREVVLSRRPVFVRSIVLTPSDEAPNAFGLRVVCGKGTYIRSIVRDIGRKLGCGAHVVRLRRMSSGNLFLEEAISFETLQNEDEPLHSRILDLSRLAENFYRFTADEERTALLRSGTALPLSSLRFSGAGILSPVQGVSVLGKNLFSHGRITREGMYRPNINIALEEAQ